MSDDGIYDIRGLKKRRDSAATGGPEWASVGNIDAEPQQQQDASSSTVSSRVAHEAFVRQAAWFLIITGLFIAYRGFFGAGRRKSRRQTWQQQPRGTRPTLTERLSLSLFGPTTLHLRHEFTLLICMMILTVAALVSPYRGAVGTWEDVKYLGLTGFVLSRHILLRWLCTNDTSTSSHPTILGTVAKILSKCCSAGQYFDAAPPSVLLGHQGSLFGGEGMILIKAWLGRITYTLVGPLSDKIRPLSSKLLSRCGGTFGGQSLANPQGNDDGAVSTKTGSGRHKRKGGSNANLGDSFSNLASTKRPSFTSSPVGFIRASIRNSEFIRSLEVYREKYIPPAQKCIFIGTFLGIMFGFFYFHAAAKAVAAGAGPTAGFPGGGGSFHSNGMTGQPRNKNQNQQQQQQDPNNPQDNALEELSGFGAFFYGVPGARHRSGGPFGIDPPTIAHILFHLGWMSTVVCLVLFGRVLLPIPDLAAGGSNVQKAIRMETKHYGGGGGSKHASKSKNIDALPWAEQYHSINSENRFRLHCRVIFLRIIENIMICALAPQTEFGCIASGHCDPTPSVWDLPGYLGVASSRNKVGGYPSTMFDNVVHDRMTSIILAFTVALVTAAVLISQVATLDRSCLAIMGYLNEEAKTRPEGKGSRSGGRHRDRRGGDIDPFSTLDKSRSNIYSKLMWKVFQGELGHPSTSRVISVASSVSLTYFGFLFLVCIVYGYIGKDRTALALIMVAVYNATGSMVDIGTLDHGKLDNLAMEIAAPLEAHKDRVDDVMIDSVPSSEEEESGITFQS